MRNIRILMVRLGIDNNDQESERLYKELENVGFDILYTGLHQTAEMILDVTLSFNADVVLFDFAPNANIEVIEHFEKIIKYNDLYEPLIVLRSDKTIEQPYIKFSKNENIKNIAGGIKKHVHAIKAV
ncbi:MAG: hypothetical protein GWP03_02690 [Proteobacteria bacterium]|nr:hypothetical protein [Pseudomonadota bacterium]